MILKGIVATTHVDRHNCRFTKEALDNAAYDTCNSHYAPSMGVDHDMSVMPIGKVIKGEIIPYGDGEYAFQAHQEIFDDFSLRQGPDDVRYYYAESQIDTRPFSDTQIEEIKTLKIDIDPVNFEINDFDEVNKYLKDECSADTGALMRKALVPDPEILFQLICGTLIFWTGKKALEKLSDKISTDIANSYDNVKKAISKVVGKLNPKNRPVTYVFREYDEYVVELIVITKQPSTISEAIQPTKIDHMLNTKKSLETFFNINIGKIQFLYNETNCEWEFNYLTTITGQVIGTEKCYDKTMVLLKNVIKNGKADQSVVGSSCYIPNEEKSDV